MAKNSHIAFLEFQRAADHAEQRGFSTSGRADDHEKLTEAGLEACPLQGVRARVAVGETFHHVVHLHGDRGGCAHRKTTAGSKRITFVSPIKAENAQIKTITPATKTGTCHGMKKGGCSFARTVLPNQLAKPTPMP